MADSDPQDTRQTPQDNTSGGDAPPENTHPHRRFGGRRSPVSIGAIGLLVVVMLAVSSFYLQSLPLVLSLIHI